ncbi:unnamed protein product [Caretta caretta]
MPPKDDKKKKDAGKSAKKDKDPVNKSGGKAKKKKWSKGKVEDSRIFSKGCPPRTAQQRFDQTCVQAPSPSDLHQKHEGWRCTCWWGGCLKKFSSHLCCISYVNVYNKIV